MSGKDFTQVFHTSTFLTEKKSPYRHAGVSDPGVKALSGKILWFSDERRPASGASGLMRNEFDREYAQEGAQAACRGVAGAPACRQAGEDGLDGVWIQDGRDHR